VLNVAGAAAAAKDGGAAYAAAGIAVLTLDADDEEGFPLMATHWAKAHAFLEAARLGGGKAVVHCVAGINRSGLIAASQLIASTPGLGCVQGVAACRKARGNVCLNGNYSFQAQLVAFCRTEGLLGDLPDSVSRGGGVPSQDAFNDRFSTDGGGKMKKPFHAAAVKGLF
jgi:hypothetical protein